jgi:hypothetical protein
MDEVSASSGYVPIGSLSAAVDGAGSSSRSTGAPSKRPQYFAALAGKVFTWRKVGKPNHFKPEFLAYILR